MAVADLEGGSTWCFSFYYVEAEMPAGWNYEKKKKKKTSFKIKGPNQSTTVKLNQITAPPLLSYKHLVPKLAVVVWQKKWCHDLTETKAKNKFGKKSSKASKGLASAVISAYPLR